ncbi:MAG: RNA polymerase sigma factor [Archangiaceae bacterium]|nr:RNA polymerase sigma factor [Archangiaceae bacterium]
MEPPRPATAGFHDIYRSEVQYVANVVRRLGVSPAHIEDLTHDVFLAAYKRQDTYDPQRPIRPWLFGFAVKRVSAFRERAHLKREVAHDEVPDAADLAPTPDEQVASRQSRDLVLQALEALDTDKRAVFILHEIDGYAVPEVADALGVPLNTAYSRLRRGREMFEAEVRRLQKAGDA